MYFLFSLVESLIFFQSVDTWWIYRGNTCVLRIDKTGGVLAVKLMSYYHDLNVG